MLQLLRRLERKAKGGGVPREDARRICCATGKDVGGDEVIDGALSKGYAVERGGALALTEAGRRAVADHV